MSDEDVEARLKKSGIAFTGVELDQSTELAAMFGDRGFARDFGTLAGRAQTEEFEKLNPVEKVIVGFGGATRSITAGVSDLLGINQAGLEEFERLERPAIDAVPLGFGTVGEIIPNFAAPGRVIAGGIGEGIIEALKAPEGERLATGVQAAGESALFAKGLQVAVRTGTRVERVIRDMGEDPGRPAPPAIDDVDLISPDAGRPLSSFQDRIQEWVRKIDEGATTDGIPDVEAVGAPERKRLVDRAEDLGIFVSNGQRYGNKPLQSFENSLATNPITSRPWAENAERNSVRYAQILARAIGERGDAVTPAMLGNATARLSGEFSEIARDLDALMPGEAGMFGPATEFFDKIDGAALQEIGDIRNMRLITEDLGQDVASGMTGRGRQFLRTIEENLKVRPMVDVIKFKIDDGSLSGTELMGIRSSLVDEVRTLSRNPTGAAQGTQLAAMGDMVDAIDDYVVRVTSEAGNLELAGRYAVARSQWRVLQAVQKGKALDNLGEVRARSVDSILRTEYPVEYRRGRLTGQEKGRSFEVQALADFMDATRIGASVTADIVGNSGTATRQVVGDLLQGDITGVTGLLARMAVGSRGSRAFMEAGRGPISGPAGRILMAPAAEVPQGVVRGGLAVGAAQAPGGTAEELVELDEERLVEFLEALGF